MDSPFLAHIWWNFLNGTFFFNSGVKKCHSYWYIGHEGECSWWKFFKDKIFDLHIALLMWLAKCLSKFILILWHFVLDRSCLIWPINMKLMRCLLKPLLPTKSLLKTRCFLMLVSAYPWTSIMLPCVWFCTSLTAAVLPSERWVSRGWECSLILYPYQTKFEGWI